VTTVTFSQAPQCYFCRVILYYMPNQFPPTPNQSPASPGQFPNAPDQFPNAPNQFPIKKCLALALLLFPCLSLLAFAMHFRSLGAFFYFTWSRPPYNAEKLFNALVSGRGHWFFIAHFVVYLAVPFLLVGILVLAWYLFRQYRLAAFLGAALGVTGCLAMAGVVASWLSFAAVGRVHPEYYDGARAALVELTRMTGILQWNSVGSYLIFVGFMILSTGLFVSRQFPRANMIGIFLGSLLFMLFMDMDNWMFIGTILLFIGLLPVIKRLWRKE
jgi:hypothetical protein